MPQGRPRRRWEDNIKMDLQEVGCGDMDWIALAQDRDRYRALVNKVMDWIALAQDRDRYRALVNKVMDWIALAQDRDRYRALVNKVMDLWGP